MAGTVLQSSILEKRDGPTPSDQSFNMKHSRHDKHKPREFPTAPEEGAADGGSSVAMVVVISLVKQVT